VKPALHDFDPLILAGSAAHPIHQPMLAGDAAGPPAGKIASQPLRLAKPGKWAASRVLDQFVDPTQDVRIIA
jgi:hypothetical protein